MLQLLTGAYVASAVSCLAQMGIPDLVEAGPKSALELRRNSVLTRKRFTG
jgi:hypothetical protein